MYFAISPVYPMHFLMSEWIEKIFLHQARNIRVGLRRSNPAVLFAIHYMESLPSVSSLVLYSKLLLISEYECTTLAYYRQDYSTTSRGDLSA
jgi:hypothetical protein